VTGAASARLKPSVSKAVKSSIISIPEELKKILDVQIQFTREVSVMMIPGWQRVLLLNSMKTTPSIPIDPTKHTPH
jgi:hypothetical protein